ncbi:DEAD/DEAH box helicase [Streptomyces achromogenes]|uniref:DEAD/DEAH box helicase n=1 Tax=Streptomyces achromogenes TaxID=67255 RepID=UPI0036F6325E
MTFHGLFIGIDYYESEYTPLRFARRDATVLGALFADNLEGNSTLLLDGDATKEKIVTEMRHIAATSSDDDFVVITFSGHGIAGGGLATYDTTPNETADTCLSLDELTELAGTIRARALLLVLDCCFSGHAADKVLPTPQDAQTSRDGSVAATRKLAGLREVGVVIAASGRDQEAFEDPDLRHGRLSYYLIQGLLGDTDAVDDGKVYVLKLAHFVSKRVSSHPEGLSKKTQNPVLGGQISNFPLDVFKKGSHYHATADAARPQPADADLTSLAEYGIPSPLIEAWKERIEKLNSLQLDAINNGALLEGMNVLVCAPTSTGKTMVGELSAMRAVAQGKKAVFLLPTRALVTEQYKKFSALYGPLGFRVIRATGQLHDHMPDLIKGDYELAIVTYEKFIGMLPRNPGLLKMGVLVLDEIQTLMLPQRGPLLETLLTWLRVRAASTDTPQIVGLSAVLGKPIELARWLRANLVTATRRDVPLVEGVLGPDGRYCGRDQEGNVSTEQLLEPLDTVGFDVADQLVTRLVRKLIVEGQQVIVFRSTRGKARTLARNLARTLGLPAADTVLAALTNGDGGRTTDLLRTCLEGGVAFHIADLTTEERQLLEHSFARPDSEVRVLVSTTTLAQGVNLPADTVVLCEMEHPSADSRPYYVSEYKNMAGRAGRAGYGEKGRSIILSRGSADSDQKWRQYVLGEPEPVRSVLLDPATDVRPVVLSALAAPAVVAHHRSGPDLERFLAATFATHQSRASGSPDPFPSAEVRHMVNELLAGGFLKRTPGEPEELSSGLFLTDLGRLAVGSGLGVDSIAAVAKALAAVPPEAINRATLICAAQLTSELDDVRFQQLPRAPHGAFTRLAGALKARGAAEPVLSMLMSAPPKSGISISRARRAISCLMWMEGMRLADIERVISDPGKVTRPETPGPVQHAVQRAADVITTVIEIAFHVHPAADLGSLPDVLPTQLELGIPAGLVLVAWHAEVPLGRTVYLNLARAGLTSPADILAADPSVLLDCVGGSAEQHALVREASAAAQEGADEARARDLFPFSAG